VNKYFVHLLVKQNRNLQNARYTLYQNLHILYEVLFESLCSYLNDVLDHIYLQELQQQVIKCWQIKLTSDKKYSKKTVAIL
jgi:predicted nucleotidyltransferase